MFSLPIVHRELRVSARRKGTYSLRCAAALGAIVIGGFVYLSTLRSSQQAFGQALFGALAGLCMLFCLLAGVRLTADCLSVEKRDGTLGLLFLTDLKGHDIIFGKLAATSLSGFYRLLAVFPIMAVPLLTGGITNAEFWRMTLVLVNAILFSLAIGIFTSSLSREARKTAGAAFFLILFFTAACPGIAGWIKYKGWSNSMLDLLFLPSPAYSFQLSSDNFYRFAAKPFWWSMGIIHGLTWLFLLLACFIVPRSWQDKPAGPRAAGWRDRWRAFNYGNAALRKSFRTRLLNINAFYWRAARSPFQPAWVWALFVLPVAAWMWGYKEFGGNWFNEGTYFITVISFNLVIKYWVASEAGRRLAEDRKLGALELLLSTRLSVRDILRGQFLALRRQFLAPLILTILAESALMMMFLWKDSRPSDEEFHVVFAAWWVTGLVLLVADTITLSWVGMLTALTVKNPNQVAGSTLARVMMLPCVACAVTLAALNLVIFFARPVRLPGIGWKFFLGFWLALRLSNNLLFGLSARCRLQSNFRQLASQPFVPAPLRFARWLARRRV